MEDNLDFYEEEDAYDGNTEDLKGITDVVSKLSFVDMQYPCICLKNNIILPKHKWLIISKLIKQSSTEKRITIYFIRNEELLKAGRISGVQVKALVDIVGLENLFGYHSKENILEKDKLYVLVSQ